MRYMRRCACATARSRSSIARKMLEKAGIARGLALAKSIPMAANTAHRAPLDSSDLELCLHQQPRTLTYVTLVAQSGIVPSRGGSMPSTAAIPRAAHGRRQDQLMEVVATGLRESYPELGEVAPVPTSRRLATFLVEHVVALAMGFLTAVVVVSYLYYR